MENAYFPIFTDISAKKILVVGGGNIAQRRVNTLLPFDAVITVIAPHITDHLARLEEEGKINCLHKSYESGDIAGADMVLAATDNPQLNRAIFKECREEERKKRKSILVNVADDKTLCDFYFPSVIHKDDFIVAISSGGEAPGRVKVLRKKLESMMERS